MSDTPINLEDYTGQACYLIHFDSPYESQSGKKMTVQHYIGWTVNVHERVKTHRAGRGAHLLNVVQKCGITWKVVRIWEGGGWDKERELKRWKNHSKLCPICKELKRKKL